MKQLKDGRLICSADSLSYGGSLATGLFSMLPETFEAFGFSLWVSALKGREMGPYVRSLFRPGCLWLLEEDTLIPQTKC